MPDIAIRMVREMVAPRSEICCQDTTTTVYCIYDMLSIVLVLCVVVRSRLD